MSRREHSSRHSACLRSTSPRPWLGYSQSFLGRSSDGSRPPPLDWFAMTHDREGGERHATPDQESGDGPDGHRRARRRRHRSSPRGQCESVGEGVVLSFDDRVVCEHDDTRQVPQQVGHPERARGATPESPGVAPRSDTFHYKGYRGGEGIRTPVLERSTGTSPGAARWKISPRGSHRQRTSRPARVRCSTAAPRRNRCREPAYDVHPPVAGDPEGTAT